MFSRKLVNHQEVANQVGDKQYELANHLGNVLNVVTDRKLPFVYDSNTSGLVDYFTADVKSYSDYYPFGMQLPNRHDQEGGNYRYGFQGQEKDDEIKGEGNSLNYEYRMHDPRIGRFFAIDPLTADYPHYTPYSFSGNKLIAFKELEGAEELNAVEKQLFATWTTVYGVVTTGYLAYEIKKISKFASKVAVESGLEGLEDGEADAFRHAFWNAMLTAEIGSTDARAFTTAHETGSEAMDKKSNKYNPKAVEMDLHNNKVGREIANKNPDADEFEMGVLINNARKQGKLKVFKTKTFNLKDAQGNTTSIDLPVNQKENPVIIDNDNNKVLIDLLKANKITVDHDVKNYTLTKSGQKQSAKSVAVSGY